MNNSKNKDKKLQELATTATESKTELPSTEYVPEQKPSSVGTSTQMQLRLLAKKFALDAGMQANKTVNSLEERSQKRKRLTQLRKQQNMENIVEKTQSYCSDDDIANRIDNDWFSSYVNLAEDISNSTMQNLWAKILAGEIYQPGAYSLKTLQIFRSMSMHDAKLLAKACSLAVKDNSRKNMRLISGCYQQPGLLNIFDKQRQLHVNLSHFGLNYADLLTLADNHLIFIQESESAALEKNDKLNFNYNGITLSLSAKKPNSMLRFYKFTPIGVELAHLISDNPDNQYVNHLKAQLSHHFTITQQ